MKRPGRNPALATTAGNSAVMAVAAIGGGVISR
jgi:hypothetical protein